MRNEDKTRSYSYMKLSKDDILDMERMYDEGKSVSEIAEYIGCSGAAISKRLIILGKKGRRRGAWSEEEEGIIKELWNDGYSTKVISKKINRTVEATSQHLLFMRKRGINLPLRVNGKRGKKALVEDDVKQCV